MCDLLLTFQSIFKTPQEADNATWKVEGHIVEPTHFALLDV